MDRAVIIKKIEHIANKSKDDQTKLNALSYLLNRLDAEYKFDKFEQEQEKSSQELKKKIALFTKALY